MKKDNEQDAKQTEETVQEERETDVAQEEPQTDTDVAVDGDGDGEAGAPQDQGTAEEQPQAAPAEDLSDQLKASQDKYIRLLAEFDNFKRRTSREYERMVESATEALMLDLTEVRENFERALKAESESHDKAAFVEGTRLIANRFNDILGKHGLEAFAEEGEEFDPVVHDAMLKAPHADIEEDHISQVVERGYRLRGHVIKHARVIVSAGPPEGGSGSASDTSETNTQSGEGADNG